MQDFRDKVVVVTGAASGMGRAIALAFAREGSKLAICDVNEEGLISTEKEIKSMGCEVYSQLVDVSKADQVERFRDMVYEKMGRVDVLCNIAGVGSGGMFEDIPLEDWDWIVGANMWGVIYGCHFFYPRMVEQGTGGHIVNISSLTGLAPGVFATSYVTTKHAVQGFSQTLRPEAALHGIGVSALCPGYVNTNIGKNTRVRWGSELMDFRGYIKKLRGREITEKARRRLISPDKVARRVIEGIRKDKGVIIIGLDAYLPDILYRISKRGYGLILKRMAYATAKAMESG